MRSGSRLLSRPYGWLIAIAIAAAFTIAMSFIPSRKPDDSIRRLRFSLPFPTVLQTGITSDSRHDHRPASLFRRRRHHRSYAPRSVTITSDGTAFRAYLLDMTDVDVSQRGVAGFEKEYRSIEGGGEPSIAPIEAKAVGVTEAHFELDTNFHIPPFGDGAPFRMLVVACNEEAEVTVRVSYGR